MVMQGYNVNTIYYEIANFIYGIVAAHVGYEKLWNKYIKTVLL